MKAQLLFCLLFAYPLQVVSAEGFDLPHIESAKCEYSSAGCILSVSCSYVDATGIHHSLKKSNVIKCTVKTASLFIDKAGKCTLFTNTSFETFFRSKRYMFTWRGKLKSSRIDKCNKESTAILIGKPKTGWVYVDFVSYINLKNGQSCKLSKHTYATKEQQYSLTVDKCKLLMVAH